MSRGMRKVLSVICAIAMVVTSMTGLNLTNVAADSTTTVIKTGDAARTALLAEISNADYNFALGKEASVSMLTLGDGGSNMACITDGTFSTANSTNTIIMIGKGSTDNAWVQVDLGAAYASSGIDRVAVQYKTTNSGPKSGYYISYSYDGVDFVTVATVGAIAGSNNQIYLDKISLTEEQAEAIPYVRFVRVTSTTNTSAYGLQVKGMAVLTDGVTKISEVDAQKVEIIENPASLTVTSKDYNQFEFVFEAGKGQEEYTYSVYIDDVLYSDNATPGQTYTITEATGGTHTVKVISHKGDLVSSGILKSIDVVDYATYIEEQRVQACKDLLLSDRNIALGKTATPSSIRDTDNPVNVTDGVLNNQFRTVTTDTTATVVIDLGQNYRLDAIESVIGFYLAGRYPKSYTIDFSLNGSDYQTVTTATGDSNMQQAEVDTSNCTLPAVRYVRFSFSSPVTANYGFQMYELGVIAKEGADLTPVEVATVYNPAAFDVEVTDYNTAEVTITADEGQEDYKYNVYIDNVAVLTGVDAGTHTINDVVAGEKVFTVKSVVGVVTSEGISVTKTVQNPSTYTYEAGLAGGTVEGGKILDETKTVDEVTYNNYSLFLKATASASSLENDTYVAANALDGNNTTRWASAHEDPQWILVDLGDTYSIYEIDIVWQNASAKDFTVECSADGENYKKVCIIEGAAANSRYENIVLTEVVEARYVKINGTARTGIYGYSIWDLGIYGPDEEDTTPSNIEGLAVAAGVATWQASAFAESYNVYCDGEFVASTVDLTYDFSNVFDGNGEYVVGVEAVNADGVKSELATVTVQYDEEETTTPAPEVKFGWEIQYPDGNGFVSTDFEMPGFTIEGIPADTAKWVCGARLQNIPVEAGKVYTVSFKVVSSVNKVVPVEFTNGTGSYINVNATPEGAEYSQQFTAVGDTVKLYMPLGVDAAVDGTISEAYSITVSDVQVVEYVEEPSSEDETTTEEPTEEPSSEDETTTEAPVEVAPAAPIGLTYAGNENLPYYFAWQAVENAATYNIYVNGELVGTTNGASFNMSEDLFKTAGDYTIGVTSVGANGLESGMTTITYTVEEKIIEYTVSIDGTVVATVENDTAYTLPTDATYGYFDGTDMYKSGTSITVTSNIALTSVNDLIVTTAQGAGIKVDGEANGIRFQATVTSDNMTAVNSDAITEGMLITAEDLYTEFGNSVLDLDSTYAKIKVDNEGWFMNQEGVYCGSVVNIDDANCIRNFIARAYVTINYADGTTEVVYSDMSGARSISSVAKAIIAAGHLANFDADAQAIISAYAEY